jgi:hypothetical protein
MGSGVPANPWTPGVVCAKLAAMSEYRGTLNEELFPLLAEALAPLGLERPDLREVIRELEAAGFFTAIEAPPEDHRFLERGRLGDPNWYAIQDEELKDLADITMAIVAIGADFALTGGAATIGKLLGFLGGLRRKRVVLDAHQGFVLKTLIERPGKRGTASDLAPVVGLDAEDIEATLVEIQGLRRVNNKPGELLERQPDGTWLALDL